ncbi:hypothetical protein EVG20_g2698 [Dentipellis fragilis]|uniref:Uncharacterized protein n=1 Tax=Dentipellis fragilis TaxID=205917 RepID=A0A4Y9Z8Z7_9AGAM|nr:hypothetical protein EVG20_g2698 [Dentipellis fragilis]
MLITPPPPPLAISNQRRCASPETLVPSPLPELYSLLLLFHHAAFFPEPTVLLLSPPPHLFFAPVLPIPSPVLVASVHLSPAMSPASRLCLAAPLVPSPPAASLVIVHRPSPSSRALRLVAHAPFSKQQQRTGRLSPRKNLAAAVADPIQFQMPPARHDGIPLDIHHMLPATQVARSPGSLLATVPRPQPNPIPAPLPRLIVSVGFPQPTSPSTTSASANALSNGAPTPDRAHTKRQSASVPTAKRLAKGNSGPPAVPRPAPTRVCSACAFHIADYAYGYAYGPGPPHPPPSNSNREEGRLIASPPFAHATVLRPQTPVSRLCPDHASTIGYGPQRSGAPSAPARTETPSSCAAAAAVATLALASPIPRLPLRASVACSVQAGGQGWWHRRCGLALARWELGMRCYVLALALADKSWHLPNRGRTPHLPSEFPPARWNKRCCVSSANAKFQCCTSCIRRTGSWVLGLVGAFLCCRRRRRRSDLSASALICAVDHPSDALMADEDEDEDEDKPTAAHWRLLSAQFLRTPNVEHRAPSTGHRSHYSYH